jgi:hypothetical protein
MRVISGDVIESNNFVHPFTCLITGSTGVGKTFFVEQLIKSCRISNLEQFSRIYYFFPSELETAPVDWDDEFEDLEVSFHCELPDASFFKTVQKDSLIVFDDDWYNLTKYDEFSKAFRVYARKYKFSCIAISQSYYEGQKHGKSIRNNCDIHVLMKNYGDSTINLRAARSLGYESAFREASKEAYESTHGYVIIFAGPKVKNNKLRVQTNFFDLHNNFCYYQK